MRQLRVIAWALCFVSCATRSWGGAFWIYETGAPDIATASAGRAAAAQDASVALENPAAMTHLERSELVVGISLLAANVRFEKGQDTNVSGGNGGNAGPVFPAPSVFYVHRLTDRWRLGLSLGSYLGSGLQFDGGWAGRYYIQRAELTTAGANPSVGFRVNDWLSLGAGFTLLYGSLDQRTALNNVLDGLPDGRIKLSDEDIAFGGNAGVLFELSEQTRIGVAYRSPIKLDFEDVARFQNLGPTLGQLLPLAHGKVNLEMTLPQAVLVSGFHQLTNRLTLLANVGWQDWSDFGKTTASVDSPQPQKLTSDRGFDDTVHAAVGAQFRIAPAWLVSGGFAIDSSPVTDRRRTPDFPVDRQLRFGTGVRYDWSPSITLALAYEYVDLGDADFDVDSQLGGRLQGEFRTNHVNAVTTNLIWRF